MTSKPGASPPPSPVRPTLSRRPLTQDDVRNLRHHAEVESATSFDRWRDHVLRLVDIAEAAVDLDHLYQFSQRQIAVGELPSISAIRRAHFALHQRLLR